MPVAAQDLFKIDTVHLVNPVENVNGEFKSVSTDSRTMENGAVFFAIKGDKYDGHTFIKDIKDRAGALVVSKQWYENDGKRILDSLRIPVLVVKDTVRALGDFARRHRRRFSIPMIGVTGSSGKTTTKDMISSVLAKKYNVHCTRGNLNNHIGLPLTLFQLRSEHQVSVVELATNHPGEIEYLTSISEPTHGLITNIGKGHIEFLESVEGVAKEKGALFCWIKRDDSRAAYVNADDPRVVEQATEIRNQIRFGLNNPTMSVIGKILGHNEEGCYVFEFSEVKSQRKHKAQLRIPGKHQVYNALAASAVGLSFGVEPNSIVEALEVFVPTEKRSVIKQVGKIFIYDDTYNANPDSMRAALEAFTQIKVRGKKILILADMLELGNSSGEEHAQIGLLVSELGYEYLFTFGKESEAIYSAASTPYGGHYTDKGKLVNELLKIINRGDALLVKGSRGMKMEEVVGRVEDEIKKV